MKQRKCQPRSINIRLQQLTSLRKHMRAQDVAKRLELCNGFFSPVAIRNRKNSMSGAIEEPPT